MHLMNLAALRELAVYVIRFLDSYGSGWFSRDLHYNVQLATLRLENIENLLEPLPVLTVRAPRVQVWLTANWKLSRLKLPSTSHFQEKVHDRFLICFRVLVAARRATYQMHTRASRASFQKSKGT